jgi:hypothetical protein
MSTSKTNHTVFTKDTKSNPSKIVQIKMYEETIKFDDNIKFLGIRFDPFLTFKHQISHIKTSCTSRLNVIKTLSHQSWQLKKDTLLNIYKALTRSLIDYSGFLFNVLSEQNKNQLQIIQNNAIRFIFNKKMLDKISIADLHKMASLDQLNQRCEKLMTDYIKKAKETNNPLINEIIEDFIRYKGGREDKHKTILCDRTFK